MLPPSPYRRADVPLNLLSYSTGFKFLGEGERQARKHGAQGRHQWRRVHLAMDNATSEIPVVEFTPSRHDDSPTCRNCWTKFLNATKSAQ